LGVTTVHQTLGLIDDLSIMQNLFLGNEWRYPPPLKWLGVLRKRAMRAKAASDIERLSIGVRSVDEMVAGLSGGQRQSIAVARAVSWGRRIVIMDEPTAALGVRESAQVLDVIRHCRDEGFGVILISHDMQEVFQIADRATVLRLGLTVGQVEMKNSSADELVGLITGAKTQAGEVGHERC
jgi:ABC-type sugar transport system ATPase subunit